MGDLVVEGSSAWPLALHEEARASLEAATRALHDARRPGDHRPTAIALAHSRLFYAAASLAASAGPPEETPSARLLRPLLEGCLELVAAEEGSAAVLPAHAVERLPIERFPIDRCAAIAASLDRRPSDSAAILESEGLDRASFDQLFTRHHEDIQAEEKRGKSVLRASFDDAYVRRIEEERGEITVDEYAILKVAAARGAVDEAAAELLLPRRAVMPIERVWLDKIVRSAELRRRVRAAIDERRTK